MKPKCACACVTPPKSPPGMNPPQKTPKMWLNGLGFLPDWLNPFEIFGGNVDLDGEASFDLVETFRTKANEFTNEFYRLQSNAEILQANGYGAQFNDVYSRAQNVMNQVSSAADAVSGAWGWAKETFGLSGVRGMGAIPALIPAAIIAGAIAAIAYILADMIELNTRADLLREGMSPEQINATIGGPQSELSKTVIYAVLGVAAIVIVPKLLEKR